MPEDPSESEGVEKELTQEDIRDLIEAQKEEVELEKERQKTRRLELEYEERKAKHSLEAQLEDRKQERKFRQEKNKREQRYGLVLLAMVIIFLGYLVWLGYTEMVYEIIRIFVYGGAGWAAGSAAGKASAQQHVGNGEAPQQ